MPTVVVQKWEESERGFGTRPDGFSLHLSEEDRVEYVRKYWASMPDEAPDEYSRPDGSPYLADVDEETLELIRKSEHGIMRTGPLPGSGGSDGWRPNRKRQTK
jgi:hypothetical protein